MLSLNFYIIHIHRNNCSDTIYKTDITRILEITFVNRALITEAITIFNRSYPIYDLDYPYDLNAEF
jgi:hypothetical protein